jgi:hypothetical protein
MKIETLFKKLIGPINNGKLDYIFRPGLKERWGGPFNGQSFRRCIYTELLNRFSFRAIIETGTFRGSTTALFATSNLNIYTVEAEPRYYAYAVMRLKKQPHIHFYQNDSRSFLREVANNPAIPKDNIFFYLDAHWKEDLPLLDELKIIFSHWKNPVIMVDDFCVPDSEYIYDDYGPGKVLNLEYLEPLNGMNLHTYFPTVGAHCETGKKRGCIVICKENEVSSILDNMETLKKGPVI